MQIYSLLYISRSLLPEISNDQAVHAIVDGARVRNACLDITGALMFTHHHFAQYLEGRRADVDNLMNSIRHDARHTEMEILRKDLSPQRLFSEWDLAYSGPSHFADRQVSEAAASASDMARPHAAGRLLWMMREFCSPP